jgi:ankyrin repeat protein
MEYIINNTCSSTITLAWERIFGGRLAATSTMVDAWRCMFDDEDHLESRIFPAVHKTILGLVNADLRQQLELSTSTIDSKDADGRTALSWAAAKGDADAVNILLEFGANPNVCSRRGNHHFIGPVKIHRKDAPRSYKLYWIIMRTSILSTNGTGLFS